MRRIKKLNYKKIEYRDLHINFCKSRCKTIHITIKQDSNIYYVVPYFVSESDIIKFLDNKYDWIKKSLYKIKQNSLDNEGNNILNDNKTLTKEERITLLSIIKEYVIKYETLLNVKVNKYSLRKMKTLWGSCSFKTKNIIFN